MSKLLTILTPYGERYYVNDKGEISRDGKDFSQTWKVQGIESVKSSYYIPLERITADFLKNFALLYKNGNPMYTVRDLDNGTTRTWGNTKHHGIKYLGFIDKPYN